MTSTDAVQKCQWCGQAHGFKCQLVKAQEFFENGLLKRIEFFTHVDYGRQPLVNPQPNTLPPWGPSNIGGAP